MRGVAAGLRRRCPHAEHARVTQSARSSAKRARSRPRAPISAPIGAGTRLESGHEGIGAGGSAVSIRIPTSPRRMSARDAGFLYLERSHTQLHIGCIAILDGSLDRDALVARIEQRLPQLRRYAQRAMEVPLALGHPSWEDDPDFDVGHHVTRWGLPAPGGEGELREAVARLLAQPLDRERPLWEMHLFEGLAGGRSALFQKVHHCMIDGMAGAQILEGVLDGAPAPPQRGPAPPPPRGPLP